MLFWRLRGVAVGRMGAGDVMLTTEVLAVGPAATEAEPAVAARLRVLALEPVLLWRRALVEGIEKPELERRCCLPSAIMGASAPEAEALAELDEALDTTEAFCAWRSRSSSRVRRLTCSRVVSDIDDTRQRQRTSTYHRLLFLFKLLVQFSSCQRARMACRARTRSGCRAVCCWEHRGATGRCCW